MITGYDIIKESHSLMCEVDNKYKKHNDNVNYMRKLNELNSNFPSSKYINFYWILCLFVLVFIISFSIYSFAGTFTPFYYLVEGIMGGFIFAALIAEQIELHKRFNKAKTIETFLEKQNVNINKGLNTVNPFSDQT